MRSHGQSKTPEFQAWTHMLHRCDPRRAQTHPGVFASYAGRGIRVYGHWRHDFPAFLAHIGPRPGPGYSLDRIDNDRGYFPGNVRWATQKQQIRNTRVTRRLTYRGETLSVAEWAERTGLSYDAIIGRLRRGWSAERTLTTPSARK